MSKNKKISMDKIEYIIYIIQKILFWFFIVITTLGIGVLCYSLYYHLTDLVKGCIIDVLLGIFMIISIVKFEKFVVLRKKYSKKKKVKEEKKNDCDW